MGASPWSFSKIKAFEQCPKQFYHMKVAREYPETETEALLYGSAFHSAAEEYIRDGKPLPECFEYAAAALDSLNSKPGRKLCEYKFGLTADLEPCGFSDGPVWFRGIADLIILDGTLAWVIDYKTGKSSRYADAGQLELMALAIFKHFPEVDKVNAGLLFVIAKDLLKSSYSRDDMQSLWAKWLGNYSMMEQAFSNNVWNPRPSGLCKQYCPVVECVHNGRR
jgi:CRISPR/Cas system-associated exonuclease Cas4 (RecB family)